MDLPKPFDTFRLEKLSGEYKDFNVAKGDPYPLKGVTYPTAYGDIRGYTGEDKHPLDIFVGTGVLFGYFVVSRPDVQGGEEHKFCIYLTDGEEKAILDAFKPVLRTYTRLSSLHALIAAMEPFKNKE